jgi:hypothetical protein
VIPVPVIAVVAEILSNQFSHSELNILFELVGVPGDPPPGNKLDKIRLWLRRANTSHSDPLRLLGVVIQEFMEVDNRWAMENGTQPAGREKINEVLRREGLAYVKGGFLAKSGVAAVSQSLQQIIQAHDLSALQTEFDRIFGSVESDPASAVTSSCALLETLFQIYVGDNGLEMPSDKSIKPLWNVVRKHLNVDPSSMQDEDLRKIVSGLGSIVDGIAALRTHRGSAHGHAKTQYKLEPRHARLTAHAAVTLATFIFEVWMERKKQAEQ